MAETKLMITSDGLDDIIAGFTKAVESGEKLVDVAEQIGNATATSSKRALQAQQNYNEGLKSTAKELRLLGDIDVLGSLSAEADTKLRGVAKSLLDMGKKLRDVGPEGKAAFGEIIKMMVNLEGVLQDGAKLQDAYAKAQQASAETTGAAIKITADEYQRLAEEAKKSGATQVSILDQVGKAAIEGSQANVAALKGQLTANQEELASLVENISASIFSEGLPAEGLPILQGILELKQELSTLETEAKALDIIAEEFDRQRASVEGNVEAIGRLNQGEKELAELRSTNATAVAANLAQQDALSAKLEDILATSEAISDVPPPEPPSFNVGLIDETVKALKQLGEAQKLANSPEELEVINAQIAKLNLNLKALREVGQEEVQPITPESVGLLEQAVARVKDLEGQRINITDESDLAALNAQLTEAKEEVERLKSIGPVAIVDPQQIGLIDQAKSKVKELEGALSKATNTEELAKANKELATARDTLGDLKRTGFPDPTPVVEKATSLKTQFNLAVLEVQRLADAFDGTITQDLVDAAVKAAELKSQVSDVNAVIAALDPDAKFQAIAGLTQSIIGGFTAVSGVLALVGVGGDQADETIAKMQSLLAVLQGANAFLGEFGKGLKALNAFVIANTTATASNTTAKAANATATTAVAGSTTAAAGATGALTTGVRTLTAAMAANPLLTAAVVLASIATALIVLGDDARDSAEGAQELVDKLEKIQSFSDNSTAFGKRKADIEAEIKLLERGNDVYGQRQLIEEKYANTSAKLRADIVSAFENEAQLREKIAALQGTTNEEELGALTKYEDALESSIAKRTALNKEGQLAELQLNRDVIAFEQQQAEKAASEADKLAKEAIARARAEAAALLKVQEDYSKAVADLTKRLAEDTRNDRISVLQGQVEAEENAGRLEQARIFRDEIIAIREEQSKEEIDLIQRNLERKLAMIELERTTSVEKLKQLSEEQKNALADELVVSGTVSLDDDTLDELEQMRANKAAQFERERTKNKADEVAKRIALDKKETQDGITSLQAFEDFAVASAEAEVGSEREKQKKILAIKIEYAKKQIELLEQTGDIGDATKAAQLTSEVQKLEGELEGLSKFSLQNVLGLSDADMQILTPLFQQAGQMFIDSLNEQVQAQRDANAAYIDLLDERLSATNAALAIEAQYREDGEANNYDRERAAQEELLRLKAEAIKEDERLARQQQRIQKITQIAQLGSAVAGLLASEASKGVIGLGIAAAAIPVLYSLFSGAKKQAESAASYFQGTPWLQLNGNPKGRDTIPVMAHEGERIIPTRDNEKHWNILEGLRTGDPAMLQRGIEETVKRFGLADDRPSLPSINFELPDRIERERADVKQIQMEAAVDPVLRETMIRIEESNRVMMEDALARVERVGTSDDYIEFHKGSKRRIKKVIKS
jgi:hypothetical protein